MICTGCGEEFKGRAELCGKCYAKKYRRENKEQVKEYAKMRRVRDKDKIREWQSGHRNKMLFGGKRYSVLERDNFECQMCGMSQRQHIILYNRELLVHHVDFNGRGSDNPNNDMDNLLIVCGGCHNTIHKSKTHNIEEVKDGV